MFININTVAIRLALIESIVTIGLNKAFRKNDVGLNWNFPER